MNALTEVNPFFSIWTCFVTAR